MGRNNVSKPPAATSDGKHVGESLLCPEEHVLATLEADGSRRWLFPRILRLSLTNRTTFDRTYTLSVTSPASAKVRTIEPGETRLSGGEHRYVPILISASFAEFNDGRCPIKLKIEDDQGEERVIEYMLLGPYQAPSQKQP